MTRAKSNGHFDTCGCPGCIGDSGDSAPPPDDGGTGTTPAPPKPYFWLPQIINQLSTSWGGTDEGTTRTWAGSPILYSIANGATSPNDFGGPESEGYDGAMMTAYKTGMAVLAFELWDDLIAVDLNRTTAVTANIITMAYSGTTNDDGTYATQVTSGTGAARTIRSTPFSSTIIILRARKVPGNGCLAFLGGGQSRCRCLPGRVQTRQRFLHFQQFTVDLLGSAGRLVGI
jgi:hypothetical protein